MDDEQFTLPFPDRASLLLEQRSRLLDSLIVANQKLDEKADRAIQTGSIILGLVAIATALPSGGTLALAPQVSQWINLIQIVLVLAGLVAFLVVVVIALKINFPIRWQGPGDTDWTKNSTTYLSDNSFDLLLADLLDSIDSAQTRNNFKADEVERIIKWLRFEIIMMAGALVTTLISGA